MFSRSQSLKINTVSKNVVPPPAPPLPPVQAAVKPITSTRSTKQCSAKSMPYEPLDPMAELKARLATRNLQKIESATLPAPENRVKSTLSNLEPISMKQSHANPLIQQTNKTDLYPSRISQTLSANHSSIEPSVQNEIVSTMAITAMKLATASKVLVEVTELLNTIPQKLTQTLSSSGEPAVTPIFYPSNSSRSVTSTSISFVNTLNHFNK